MKKKLPTVFVCPRCGEEAVRVTIAKDTGHATVLCALCNLKDDFPAHPAAQAIDVYSYFTDRFYGVKDPRPIIPHDRDIQYTPPEEETAEEEATAQPAMEPAPEPLRSEVQAEKPELESRPSIAPEVSSPEDSERLYGEQAAEPAQTAEQESLGGTQAEPAVESEKESQEESEPFADIMENKDKKRYSSTPLPQQTSEQTS